MNRPPRLMELHANSALPGVFSPGEGEVRLSPAGFRAGRCFLHASFSTFRFALIIPRSITERVPRIGE